ncbi:COX15/CtaA family protein [Ralstonia sp. SM1864_UCD524_TZ4]|uniref:Putative heme o oxygenase (Cytochrome aa3-controlling) transmembrane protein n=1 Tax=Ralstonia solanacearum TaxID=305 RepID=A0A0S4X5D9_RALSL|nr:COX15/CtaA family protein [Ralstonia pseudosolanacearum]CUV24385.1 putative heme o oxygenase (Cytochrome aa3-controlling) transmembrane protein [Ralstonia solanacearum]CUV37288.1 putative heme o oxygenase (Cytochrome aa3-controlling) transmembrane protein [Ralstonia solanacearum]CUV40341.1 putative heme o oxygenase (Cytochrome aa3-controlling) transmembrane protein [Ralstonia solanacearum]CUV58929.1 putative heme o oxygenase (Cytochrome aa3-controlling) transmembrane protein [Ralstonia solan
MLLQLASIGVLIALIPLCYVAVKGDRNKYRKLVWITAFLTLDLIMFGSFTRLTDSGLGCPDWPGCYGTSNPFHALDDIHAAQAAMPSGPVTWMKAWIEMTHRYFALALGVLIITLVVLAWAKRRELRQSPWYATAVLGLVCLQGAFGAWTVTLKLQPAIVVTHLLLGMSLLAALIWLGCKNDAPRLVDGRGASLRVPAAIGLALLVAQIALGGWVSTNYAVLACTDFPLCNGQWVPPMDFAHGFTFWRELGRTAGGDFISHDALVAIHWTHRVFAAVVLGYLAWLGLRARRVAGIARVATVLLTVLAVQLATGLSNIVLGWPLLAAVAHNGGAALLLLLMVRLHYLIGLAQARAPMSAAVAAV